MSLTLAKPAFFLDRDGVLIEEIGYIHRPEDVVLLPTVSESLRQIEAAGFQACVITNQAGVARGKFAPDAIHAVNQRIYELLQREGIHLNYFYACPHHPSGVVAPWNTPCPYRKPNSGLLVMAADDLKLSLAQSFFIGDKISDLQAGASVGCKTVLVRTGHGKDHVESVSQNADSLRLVTITNTMLDAVEACLGLAEAAMPEQTRQPESHQGETFPQTILCTQAENRKS